MTSSTLESRATPAGTRCSRNEALARQATDFSTLLKQWRGHRRCSQLDLALESNVSQRHISFLESGRAKPSREMVLTLVEALSLPLRERNQMLHAAGFAAVFKERSLDSEEMEAVNHALTMTLQHHDPYPAIVADRNWNLLKSNASAMKLIALLGEQEDVWQAVDPGGDKNVYRMTFSDQGFRPYIVNWSELSRSLMIRLQREVADDPGNASLYALWQELKGHIDDQGTLSDRPLAPVLSMTMRLGEPELRMFSMLSSFGTAQDVTASELRVETFYPADQQTRTFFESMAS